MGRQLPASHNPTGAGMTKPGIYAAIVPQRTRLPFHLTGTRTVATPVSTCAWGTIAPEIVALIVSYVLEIDGSQGLLVMAGVCTRWRNAIMRGPSSPLGLSLELFRCRRIKAIGSEYLLTNIREHRVSIFKEDFFISPLPQSRLFAPRAWPPTAPTPGAFAHALFDIFPGIFFVSRMPIAACERSFDQIYTWRASKKAHVTVYCPFFPSWFVPLTSRREFVQKEQYLLPFVAPMLRVFDEADGEAAPVDVADAHLWEFSLCEPVPEANSAQGLRVANRLVFSFQGRSLRRVPGTFFPPGTMACATVLTIDTDRPHQQGQYPASVLAGHRVCHVHEREVSAVVIFLVPSSLSQEDESKWARQAFATRPYLRSPKWVLRRSHRWRGGTRVLCAFVAMSFRQEILNPVKPNTQMLFPVRSLPRMARPVVLGQWHRHFRIGTLFPDNGNVANGAAVGFGGHQWSTEAAPKFYRFLAKKAATARVFARLHGGGRDIPRQLMCNELSPTGSLCTKFAKLWSSSALARPVADWTAGSPALAFFGTQAWCAWPRVQRKEKVFMSDAGKYKRHSNKTLVAFGNNPIRDNHLPAFLNNSHFANVRNYLSVHECVFGPPHKAIHAVGIQSETLNAFVPDVTAPFADDFPVFSRFRDAYGTEQTAAIARTCRVLVAGSAPMVRVPIVFLLPKRGTPGVVQRGRSGSSPPAQHPAWTAEATAHPDQDGIRVRGEGQTLVPAPSKPAAEPFPERLLVSTETAEFRVDIHHISRGYADTTVCYGTISPEDVTAACGDTLLYVFPMLEIAINDEHSITPMGVAMTTLDWVAWKLLEAGLFERLSPYLMGVLSHMALALTLPENESSRSMAYAAAAKKTTERRRDQCSSRVSPFEAQPGRFNADDLRFKHPLSADSPTERRAFTLDEVCPLLKDYLQEIVAHVVLADPHIAEQGWLGSLNGRFISRVSTAFDLWAVYPLQYYNRVMLLSALAENALRVGTV